MNSLLPAAERQGIDYGDRTDVQNLHAEIPGDRGDSRLTIQPFSLWMLIVCGLAFFFAGFFSSRYGMDFSDTAIPQPNAPAAPVSQSTVPKAPDAGAAAVVQVVMRNMKFNPATLEVKKGDVVEWKNEDITPHTATAATFDSTSIDPDKSWKHTFSEPGSFPYSCTFHPDMKAVVTVK